MRELPATEPWTGGLRLSCRTAGTLSGSTLTPSPGHPFRVGIPQQQGDTYTCEP